MSLPATKQTGKQEPAVRVLRVREARFVSELNAWDIRIEILKSPVFKNSEPADLPVVLNTPGVNLPLPALTDDRFPK